MTINQHIEAAIAGLKAYNAMQTAWRENCRAGGYASHFKDAPHISDHLLIEMLEAIVAFDDDPVETLRTIELENEHDDERDYTGRFPLGTDAEFDFANSRGLVA